MSNLTLKALLKERADSRYNDPAFMTFVEDHVPKLKTSVSTGIIPIEPSQSLKYEGDLYGLFTQYQIPHFMHYAVLKINDFNSPTEIPKGLISQILVPDIAEFKKLFNLWRAHNATRK